MGTLFWWLHVVVGYVQENPGKSPKAYNNQILGLTSIRSKNRSSFAVCKNRVEGLVHPMLSRKWHCGDSGSQFPLILWVRFCSMHKQNGKLGLSHRTLCLPRQMKGRDPHRKMSLRSYLVVSVPSAGLSNVCKAKNISLLVQNEECVCKMHSFDWRPFPPLSTSHVSRIANKHPMVHWESQTVLFWMDWVSHLLHPVHPIPSHCTMG